MADETATTVDTAGVTRTATGEIAAPDITRTRSDSTSTQTQQTTDQTKTEPQAGDKSLLNQQDGDKDKASDKKDDKAAAGAPDAYAEFTVPEGFTLDAEVAQRAGALFKELNLPQEGAQKLIDMYAAETKAAFEAPFKAYQDTIKAEVDSVKADPRLGHRLSEIKTNFTNMMNQHVRPISPQAVDKFYEAMDMTGAGNFHAFVTVMDILSQALVEPRTHVAGSKPSPFGQNARSEPVSAAQAMYPHLPSSSR